MTRERNAHANRHADRLPSTIGGMTKLAYARAKAAGIALEPLLRTADLTSHQIEDPQTVIRVRDQIKFLNLVAAALKDDLLGFHLAQTADLRELGLLYYVARFLGNAHRRFAQSRTIQFHRQRGRFATMRGQQVRSNIISLYWHRPPSGYAPDRMHR